MREFLRYQVNGNIDIYYGGVRRAVGQLIDMSASGVAFKSSLPLNVGEQYHVQFLDFGSIPCTVIRCFGWVNYGVRFDIELYDRQRLAKKLEELYGEKTEQAIG